MSRSFLAWLALLLAVVCGALAGAGLIIWRDMDDAQRGIVSTLLAERATLLVLLALATAVALGAALHRALAAYAVPAGRLAEEVRLLHTVNPSHRVTTAGAPEIRHLGAEINAFAQAYCALQTEVAARVEESNQRLEQEKNRLAALMSELAQSVVVCNAEGRILLYNARATQLLAREPDATGVEAATGGAASAPVGLGRSIFGILDKPLIVHALDRIRHIIEQHSPDPVAHFVTARAGQLLRVQMAPVLEHGKDVSGFVLILEDITQSVARNNQRDVLLRQLTEGTRASLANIRAAAETVQNYPDMQAQQRDRFTAVVRDEAQRLSDQLQEALTGHADTLDTQWPREEMLADDLVFALRRNLENGLGLTVATSDGGGDDPVWLRVDSFALVQSLTHLARQLVTACGVQELTIEWAGAGRLMRLALCWHGPPVSVDQLHEWEAQDPALGIVTGHAQTLREVLDRHGGELWCRADPTDDTNRMCLELPISHAERPRRAVPVSQAPTSRPVYYDFDLFDREVHTPGLDDRPLLALAYTVFDTETTGLSPSEGDEIISIGAVRVVNGRLLEHECFDQLIDPRRPIRKESQAVHGISDQMLANQPGVDVVLPLFHRFAEDTVLVAHNAAFDMRFLQMKEASTGIRFDQPVLDTLLLSALAHPGHGDADHRLEQIASRLGVHIIGRHTALGDAIVTGEVFLKLIPLLAERGIHTLRQAREASRRTRYAKLDY